MVSAIDSTLRILVEFAAGVEVDLKRLLPKFVGQHAVRCAGCAYHPLSGSVVPRTIRRARSSIFSHRVISRQFTQFSEPLEVSFLCFPR